MARRKPPQRDPKIPEPIRVEAAKIRLTLNEDSTLDLVHGRKTWKKVRVRLGRPLYKPEAFATVFNEKNQELGLLVHLPAMPKDSLAALEAHRLKYNLTCAILKVNSLAHQFGAAFWDVNTTKGRRQFVIRGTTEHVRWLTDDRILITDVAGNRFEIPSILGLDKKSQDHIALIL